MHHYGVTIKKYRVARGWTQATLAELWPKAGPEKAEGVNTRYVQDIEYGQKKIGDPEVLREVSKLLSIPLWEFGLSEYNPFDPKAIPGHGKVLYQETLDLIEESIRHIWSLRCAARLSEAEQGILNLNRLLASFSALLPPPTRLEKHYQLLSLQVVRLNAVTALEHKRYDVALTTYKHIYESSKDLGNPAVTALALKSWGKEVERTGAQHQAILLLEEARDISLQAGKRVIAFVHSYLARGYASSGDVRHFERAIQTGLSIAQALPTEARDGEDFVYSWSPVSAMLAEQSWGYLKIHQPQKTLDMQTHIVREIERGQDTRLHAWIPLDWAHAYLQLREPEEGVKAAREFYRRVTAMHSPHAVKQAYAYLSDLKAAGYTTLGAVKDFQDELGEKAEQNMA